MAAKPLDTMKWLLGGENGAFGFGKSGIHELLGMAGKFNSIMLHSPNMSELKRGLGVVAGTLKVAQVNNLKFPGMSPLAMGAGVYGAYSGYRDSRSSGKGVFRSAFSGMSRAGAYAGIGQAASIGAGYFRMTPYGSGLFRGAADAADLARGAAKAAVARHEAAGGAKVIQTLQKLGVPTS